MSSYPTRVTRTSERRFKLDRTSSAQVAAIQLADSPPARSLRPRRQAAQGQNSMAADQDADADGDDYAEEAQQGSDKYDDDDESDVPIPKTRTQLRSGRLSKPVHKGLHLSEDSEDEVRPRRKTNLRTSRGLAGFVAPDDDDEEVDDEGDYGAKRNGRLRKSTSQLDQLAARKKAQNAKSGRRSRGGSVKRKVKDDDWEMEGEEETPEEILSGEEDALDLHSDEPEGSQGKSYKLRERKKVDYSLVVPPEPPRDGFGRVIKRGRPTGGKGAFELGGPGAMGTSAGFPIGLADGRGKKGKEGWDALPLSMTGKDYAQAFGDPIDSSDEEMQQNAIRKNAAAGPAVLGGTASGGLLGAGGAVVGAAGGGLTGSGGTDTFGRVKKGGDSMADVDPLGLDMNIDFNSVGGLDRHIQQLKEMVTLPLLYPELFQRFKVTPPRGVLFHGPPGTGKTLVARALAASCSTDGQQISFFMRKGADCLSKWVGEAERQLRLLFEEARNSQPSIIFFDEIDGLAPVRSSKQDQIHASIVSTMLALMDGMDGRGQVVVIGATNRPDSVDPALRRPGRFDREFYFPLPDKEARKSIIDIQTKKWEPPLDEPFKLKLAEVTKGYGGADIRALCTEAALNAIQRRYPQIYSTTDRLLLDPASISVDAKDFMMSVNRLVPSSARSTASAASPLPERLQSVLGPAVQRATEALDKVLPPVSKRNPLEEALWEDDAFVPQASALLSGGDGGFGREMLLQSFEAQRVFRPRMLIHGDVGMGQAAVGAALLQHLEGYHVQSLDIGTLMGDSARTPEAAVVQLFIEAKRHKPSVIFIPGLIHWIYAVSDSVKTTFKALLDGLAPSDPILLLAIAEGPLSDLPRDVKAWFGYLQDTKVKIPIPTLNQRESYFREILDHVVRPPNEFPDALPRRKRVLEELPKAPPRPPRQLTQAELQVQAENDAKLLEHLKFRLGPVLTELRKKFKKFTREVWDEYDLRDLTSKFEWRREKGKYVIKILYNKLPEEEAAAPAPAPPTENNDAVNGIEEVPAVNGMQGQQQAQAMMTAPNGTDVMAGDVSMQNMEAFLAMSHTNPFGAQNGFDGHKFLDSVMTPDFATPSIPVASQAEMAAPIAPPAPATEEAALEAPATEATPAPAANDGGPSTTVEYDGNLYTVVDTTLYTSNLEKMQKKLYYNGYLTVGAFMDDLAKIVSNAEEARIVDQERFVKAHQMKNLAVVLLDQYVDAAFRGECDRMAARQAEREKEATEEVNKVPEPAKGERQSARVQGLEPELTDLTAIERGQKRVRSESNQPEASTIPVVATELEEPAKRARIDAEPPTPTPPAKQPPFISDNHDVSRLAAHILTKTSHFNIEQLEQLRASAFNLVWSYRSSWDRRPLIKQLYTIVDQIVVSVQEEQKDRFDEM